MTRSDGRATVPLAFLCALFVSARPTPALAAESAEAGARVLFTEGRKLADAGSYAEACPKFEESFRLDPGVGTNFNLADCLEHLGRTASAWTRFLDVASATKSAGQAERERAARARAAALEPKLSRLVVEVSSPAPGLVVERDGVAVGTASWGIAIPIDPGEHLVEATAPGKKKWAQRTMVPDAPTTTRVSVPALEILPPDEPTRAAPLITSPASRSSAPRAEPDERWSIPVVALGALGTAALTTSVVLAFNVQAKNDEAEKLCPASTCGSIDEKTRHDTAVSDAHRDRNLSYVSAGIGGVALLAAVYLFWRPFRSTSTNAPATRFTARPLNGPPGARLEVAW